MAEEKNKPSQASIITVIQDMVKNGENEEKIVSTLKDLGVEPEQAKRLLLLAEANTFAVLHSEIGRIVKEYFEKEKPELGKFIKQEIGSAEQEMTEKVEKRALNAFKEDQQFIENQATMFQARINQSVKNILQLNQQTKQQTMDIGGRLANSEREVWALKHRVFGSKTVRAASSVLIGLQVALVVTSGYFFMTTVGSGNELSLVIAMAIGGILAALVYFAGLRG